MAREEVLAIITDTLEQHPGFEFDDETEAPDSTQRSQRDKARILLEYLLKNRWLEEPPRRDWRRTLQFDAHGATLIAALRKIAWPDAAVFTDKLIAVCALLANEVEILERPWQTVENCLSNVREGLNELRSMQKSVQRFTRRQLEEETLSGNLSVVFDDYSRTNLPRLLFRTRPRAPAAAPARGGATNRRASARRRRCAWRKCKPRCSAAIRTWMPKPPRAIVHKLDDLASHVRPCPADGGRN